jgi:hypothetical protein
MHDRGLEAKWPGIKKSIGFGEEISLGGVEADSLAEGASLEGGVEDVPDNVVLRDVDGGRKAECEATQSLCVHQISYLGSHLDPFESEGLLEQLPVSLHAVGIGLGSDGHKACD